MVVEGNITLHDAGRLMAIFYRHAKRLKRKLVSQETLEIGKGFGEALGKSVVIAQDTPVFIVNRLVTPFLLNAIRMLESGSATRDDIDKGLELGMNHPMGPLRLLDLIGLDSFYSGTSAIYEESKDVQYAPPNLLKKWLPRAG